MLRGQGLWRQGVKQPDRIVNHDAPSILAVRLGMREVPIEDAMRSDEGSFAACIATILELPFGDVVVPDPGEDVAGRRVSRWLGGFGVGLVAIANPTVFAWPGPWIARIRRGPDLRAVVMFGVPSGVVWDPADVMTGGGLDIETGYLIAAADIAEARPARAVAPSATGALESIWIAPHAAAPTISLSHVTAIAGLGLDGDRHVLGTGTFPSKLSGSALTLIEAEVCESFSPALQPEVHRRNLVTRAISLDRLVGHEFTIGEVRCRGVRRCEPCVVIQRYAQRPILRALVHRGGLRADILSDGMLRVGDAIRVVEPR